jgi:hypothetical protein
VKTTTDNGTKHIRFSKRAHSFRPALHTSPLSIESEGWETFSQECTNPGGKAPRRVLKLAGQRIAARILSVCLASMMIVNWAQAAGEPRVRFVVEGKIEHHQYGSHPFHEVYNFRARSEGEAWSVSMGQARSREHNFMAVGTVEGIFINFDLRSSNQRRREEGLPSGWNDSQSVVLSNTVPNFVLKPYLGPIWLTYLSAHYFSEAESGSLIPPPFAYNIAGGSPLPPYSDYRQRSIWTLEESTGLPAELVSMDDDGYLKGMLAGHLAKAAPYPSPFDKGFTNLVFKVMETKEFLSAALPKKASLEVFWVKNGRLERIHLLILEASAFHEAPAAPIPQLAPLGLAAIVDARIHTSEGPALVHYAASNRFLAVEELQQLPAFKDAVRHSLYNKPPPLIEARDRPTFLIPVAILFVIFIPLIYWLLKARHSQ